MPPWEAYSVFVLSDQGQYFIDQTKCTQYTRPETKAQKIHAGTCSVNLPDFTFDCIKLHEKFKMEEICEQIRLNKIDRMFYKEKCLKINNLSRKEWIDTENPLLVAVECNRVDLVDFFIYVGININSIQRNGNTIKVIE